MRVVDADAHVLEPEGVWRSLPDWCRLRISRDEQGHDHVSVGDRELTWYYSLGLSGTPGAKISDHADPRTSPRPEEAHPGGFDPHVCLTDMDAEGIDATVLLPTIAAHFWGMDDVGAVTQLAAAYNDWLAAYCSAASDRLFGAAVVPFQDPRAAADELRRTHSQHGFRIAFVRPNPCAGRSIADPANEPFWDAAEELGVAIALHEGTSSHVPTLGSDRLVNPFIRKAISHPFEQMLALAQLISFGVLERHPSLHVCCIEAGGGWVPYWIDRLDGLVHSLGGFCPEMRLLPSEYFARQCWVSFDVDERTLPLLADLVGVDRIVWGSDYPHHDSAFPGAVKTLEKTMAALAEAARTKILGQNAVELYRLSRPKTSAWRRLLPGSRWA